ncbi:MAG: cyclic nucleotide-binding domain-containing protein [Gammaproteobacteria bacterium]|nr:cyclic nucleotide-binding domain-containing protein [Gammaproteobacteria bacterium]
MLLHQIQRIEEFSQVPNCELRSLASSAQVLCIPTERWVVQNRKEMRSHFYLLKGTVATLMPKRVVKSVTSGTVRHFYPGCEAVRTKTSCQILLVADSRREFLMSYGQAALNAKTSQAEGWLRNFLGSHMVRNLEPKQWQQLLSSFKVQHFRQGADLLCCGDSADCCFVVEQGHGVVHRGSTTLRHLAPGDFFGEDALILNGRRNANVTALDDMVVHEVPRKVFSEVILRTLVHSVGQAGVGITLKLGENVVAGAVSISLHLIRDQATQLDHRVSYYVDGGSVEQRTLCAFLLLQRGIRCFPVIPNLCS